MTALIDLRLSENRFIGAIPVELAQLFRMENLHLSDNQFTGTIPPLLFGQLTRLMEIGIAKNGLQGSLPTTLGHLLDLSKSRHVGVSGIT
jgi:Leucine-rich repeat (LRR) protein